MSQTFEELEKLVMVKGIDIDAAGCNIIGRPRTERSSFY